MAKGDSLADQLFNRDTVGQLADHFDDAGVFCAGPFVTDVMDGLHDLELKARINHIADVLARHLPVDFGDAVAAIYRALPQPLDPDLQDDDFGDFIYAPLGVFVENHRLEGTISICLDLLEALTMRFSMEFSIRVFLNNHSVETMQRIRLWATHENYHVRRFASEGTRPRLPWGHNVGLTPDDTLPILDMLYADETRFVTRSVANHLNDITKTNPEVVIERLDRWQYEGKQSEKELTWMRKHALRGLIKAGHPAAMRHLGYRPDVPIEDAQISIAKTVKRGEKVGITVDFTPQDTAPMIVDYVVDYMKSNRKTAPKVFKLKVLDGKAHQPVTITKNHHFNDIASTFRLYPGAHRVHLQINGRIVASAAFDLS
ncbi:MAG: 3-methyladenine DNA glycosylase AlkC [Yoonia sp.]|jgi:3-methyladenine DNA glycosylase AlkC